MILNLERLGTPIDSIAYLACLLTDKIEGTLPITFSVLPARRLVQTRVVGDFDAAEIFQTISGVTSHPDYEPGFDILSDHREIGEPITPGQLKDLTGLLRQLADRFAGGHMAVVTTKPASYGMMRALSMQSIEGSLQVEVFKTMEEAEEYLASVRDRKD